MDREAVEDVVHASLGRHLRVTCVLGLLFLGVGFVLGHYVAAQHARELSDRWADRAEELSQQVVLAQEALKAELAQVRELAQSTRRDELTRSAHREEMLSETRRLAHAAEDLRQSLIARCIAENQREQARILQELQPYLDRKLTLQAIEVSETVKTLFDSQVTQLKTLATVEAPAPTAPADPALPIRSNISPISAESDTALCPVPEPCSLDPVAEVTTHTDQEPVALMPMPTTPMVHMPVQAEPTNKPTALPSGQPQFFTAPRKPRLFIPARKPLEISTATDPVVR
jgi:hypothetical protein